MAVGLRRTWYVRHGHLQGSFPRQQRHISNSQSGYPCTEAGAITGQTTAQCIAPVGGDEKGRRETEHQRVKKRPLNSPFAIFVVLDQNHKFEENFVFRTG